MRIQTLVVGALQVNCHIVSDGESPDCMVVDPGGSARAIIEAIEDAKLAPQWIVNTHAHGDHIGGNAQLKERYPDTGIRHNDARIIHKSPRNLNSEDMAGGECRVASRVPAKRLDGVLGRWQHPLRGLRPSLNADFIISGSVRGATRCGASPLFCVGNHELSLRRDCRRFRPMNGPQGSVGSCPACRKAGQAAVQPR